MYQYMHVAQKTIASENCTYGAIVLPVTAYAHACGAGNLRIQMKTTTTMKILMLIWTVHRLIM
jgi:hypothetical protein